MPSRSPTRPTGSTPPAWARRRRGSGPGHGRPGDGRVVDDRPAGRRPARVRAPPRPRHPVVEGRRAQAWSCASPRSNGRPKASGTGREPRRGHPSGRAVIDLDPLRESAYRLMMAAHRDAGRIRLRRCGSTRSAGSGSPRSWAARPRRPARWPPTTGPFIPFAGEDWPEAAPRRGAARTQASTFADLALTMETVGLEEVASATSRVEWPPSRATPTRTPGPGGGARSSSGRPAAFSGATDQLRRISLLPGRRAPTLGSGRHFGAVAALASTTTGVGEYDEDTEDLCARGGGRCSATTPRRGRILALQSEMRSGVEAVAHGAGGRRRIARGRRRPGLLLDTLLVLDQNLAWPSRPGPPTGRRGGSASRSWTTAAGGGPVRPSSRSPRLQGDDARVVPGRGRPPRRAVDAGRPSGSRASTPPRLQAVLAHLAGDLVARLPAGRPADGRSPRRRSTPCTPPRSLPRPLRVTAVAWPTSLPIIEDMAAKNPPPLRRSPQRALGPQHRRRPRRGGGPAPDGLVGPALDDAPATTSGPHPRPPVEGDRLDGTADHARRLPGRARPCYAGQLCAGAHATVVLGSVDWCRGMPP